MDAVEIPNEESPTLTTGVKIGIGFAIVLLIALVTGAIYYLLQATTPTAKIRDIFVIFLGFEMLVIGFSAILLIIQGARLFNMFQNEIKPVLDAANETMSTIRGTTLFLSDSIVQPAIKISSFFATVRGAMELFRKTLGI